MTDGPEMMSRGDLKGLAFDDPETWGYCGMCAWICTVDPSVGLLVQHRRIRNGHEDALCSGSLKIPIDEVPAVAVARKLINLRKDLHRARVRAMYQRERWQSRREDAALTGVDDGEDYDD